MNRNTIDLKDRATPLASTASTREEIMAALRIWLRHVRNAIRSLDRLRNARLQTNVAGGFIKGLKCEVDQIDESIAVLLCLQAPTSKKQLRTNKRGRKKRPRTALTRS